MTRTTTALAAAALLSLTACSSGETVPAAKTKTDPATVAACQYAVDVAKRKATMGDGEILMAFSEFTDLASKSAEPSVAIYPAAAMASKTDEERTRLKTRFAETCSKHGVTGDIDWNK